MHDTTDRHLDDQASTYFRFRDLLAGETCDRLRDVLDLTPHEPRSWEHLAGLACNVLDPLREEFGALQITYGFSPPPLARAAKGPKAPNLDQHAACERTRTGQLLCAREGAAVDLRVPGRTAAEVARFVRAALPFDRLYFYGADRSLHVSWHPSPIGSVCDCRRTTPRRVPLGEVLL